jgi:hypothetical protein
MKRAIAIGVAVAAQTTGCHNSRARVAGLAFDTLSLDAVPGHAEVWEKAVRKLRGRSLLTRTPSQ